MIPRGVAWVLALAYSALIFFMSSLSHPPVPPLMTRFDKMTHLCEYAVFAALWAEVFAPRLRGFARLFLVTLVFSLAYGASDEFHQRFVPGRESSLYDLLADGVGAAGGVGIWRFARRFLL